MSVGEWLKSGKYLPAFMRDFHDQKALFKRIDENVQRAQDEYYKISWTQAHVYTIDFFLWFMAAHGYTLQRSRQRLPFGDIDATMEDFDKRGRLRLAEIFKEGL